MIYGIGTDLVETDRIGRVIEKWGDKFTRRVFSDREIDYCRRHAHASIHYGARFAVKESFLKALGVGLGMGVKLIDIETLNEETGRPYLKLYGGAQSRYETAGVVQMHVSITHTQNYASAIVLLEK